MQRVHTITRTTSGLADGIDFIENDAVKFTVIAHLFLFLDGVLEQGSDVGLGLTDVLVQNFGTIDDLGRQIDDLGPRIKNTLGSWALRALPICLAIRVLPQPGGP